MGRGARAGRVEALCVSARRGERKQLVDSGELRAEEGIAGDAHAADGHRQVSLLAVEDVREASRALGREIAPGEFAENVLVSGLELGALGLGTRVRLGPDAVVSVTQIGKVCHAPCEIGRATGECIMPRRGLFARVESGGCVRPGDAAEAIEVVGRERFQVVVLTVSDRCSRGEAEDTSGPAVAERLEEALGVHVYRREILPDEQGKIAARLAHYAGGHSIDLVVTTGGTGFGPRDVTPEATREVATRPAPGLDEAMRAASMSKTPHAMLSRGASGIRGSTLILNLPGSERGAIESLDAVLGALGHGLYVLRGGGGHHGR